jgi:hypothetical protein
MSSVFRKLVLKSFILNYDPDSSFKGRKYKGKENSDHDIAKCVMEIRPVYILVGNNTPVLTEISVNRTASVV